MPDLIRHPETLEKPGYLPVIIPVRTGAGMTNEGRSDGTNFQTLKSIPHLTFGIDLIFELWHLQFFCDHRFDRREEQWTEMISP